MKRKTKTKPKAKGGKKGEHMMPGMPRGKHGDTSKNPLGPRMIGKPSTVKVPC